MLCYVSQKLSFLTTSLSLFFCWNIFSKKFTSVELELPVLYSLSVHDQFFMPDVATYRFYAVHLHSEQPNLPKMAETCDFSEICMFDVS